MVIRIGNPDEDNENQEETGNSGKWSRSIWLTILEFGGRDLGELV